MASSEVEYLLTVNVDNASTQLRKLESLLLRNLSYVRRMSGGNEDLVAFIDWITRTITTLRTLQQTMIAVHAVRMATGDPIAWATAITSVIGLGITAYDYGASVGDMQMRMG